jgi:hypothetical protein
MSENRALKTAMDLSERKQQKTEENCVTNFVNVFSPTINVMK